MKTIYVSEKKQLALDAMPKNGRRFVTVHCDDENPIDVDIVINNNVIVDSNAHPKSIGFVARKLMQADDADLNIFTYSGAFLNQVADLVMRKMISHKDVQIIRVDDKGECHIHPFDRKGWIHDWPVDFFDYD